MKKYLNKICITCYLILSVLVLSLFFAWYNRRNVISDNGSGQATVYVEANDVESRFSDLSSYQSYLNRWAELVNNASKDNDCFFLKSVKKVGEEYQIVFKFRRISTVGTSAGFGTLNWQRLTDVFESEAEKLAFQKLLNGNYTGTFFKIDGDEMIRDVSINKGVNHYQYAVVEAKTGQKLSFDAFEKQNANGDLVLASFKIIDVANVNRIVVNFDSPIRHYSSEGVKLLDKNTVEITPSIYQVNKLSQDGKSYEEIQTKCAIGYVTVDKSAWNVVFLALPFVGLVLGFVVMEILVKKISSRGE